jgi:hypothetical protein
MWWTRQLGWEVVECPVCFDDIEDEQVHRRDETGCFVFHPSSFALLITVLANGASLPHLVLRGWVLSMINQAAHCISDECKRVLHLRCVVKHAETCLDQVKTDMDCPACSPRHVLSDQQIRLALAQHPQLIRRYENTMLIEAVGLPVTHSGTRQSVYRRACLRVSLSAPLFLFHTIGLAATPHRVTGRRLLICPSIKPFIRASIRASRSPRAS